MDTGEPKENYRHPFEHKLVPSEFDNNKLAEFQDDPDKVIRFWELSRRSNNLEDFMEDLKFAKQELEILESEYGINIPGFQMVVGKGQGDLEGEVGVYIVTDKIEGKNLSDLLDGGEITEEIAAEADEALSRVLRYISDRKDKGNRYLGDIDSVGQYVYGINQCGKKQGSKLYLVDLDPRFSNPIYIEEDDDLCNHFDFGIRRRFADLGLSSPKLDRELKRVGSID